MTYYRFCAALTKPPTRLELVVLALSALLFSYTCKWVALGVSGLSFMIFCLLLVKPTLPLGKWGYPLALLCLFLWVLPIDVMVQKGDEWRVDLSRIVITHGGGGLPARSIAREGRSENSDYVERECANAGLFEPKWVFVLTVKGLSARGGQGLAKVKEMYLCLHSKC